MKKVSEMTDEEVRSQQLEDWPISKDDDPFMEHVTKYMREKSVDEYRQMLLNREQYNG